MKIVTDVQTMRKSDAATIQAGTDSKELMYLAGKGIFESYHWKGPVAIVCGSGNNAGDGYVLATLLYHAKIACRLILLANRFSEDGAYYYGKCKEIGIKTEFFSEDTTFDSDTEIVDCIFGTGFCGEVSGPAADLIRKINVSGKTVISADINSGLNGDNGLSNLCVKSDLTVSIGFFKAGHFLGMAKDVIGRLVNLNIGIDLHGNCYSLVEKADFAEVLRFRKQASHKGSYGYVSIIGGCKEYAGAAKLANLSCAALRSGCGVAKLIVPQSIADSVSPYLLESTLACIPDREGKMCFVPDEIDRVLRGQAALAIGMGWGRSADASRILEYILRHYEIPVVIDADGLNTLAEMGTGILKESKCQILLTPHPKEMERLCKKPISQILSDPIGVVSEFARENRVCVLLKGTCTVVSDGNTTYLVDRGCAGMATAGSGDVLSGILVGLLGFNALTPLVAACGAYIAGLAGELAQEQINPISMLASDTVSHISKAVGVIVDSFKKA